MLDAHVNAAVLVGSPFAAHSQPFDFGSQDIGGYAQWPAMQWCSNTFDPRFRPWYSTAVSGPKDVVIVLDGSGSMLGSRIGVAKAGALKVLDTLTWTDSVAIVVFDDEVRTTAMHPATDSAKESLRRWIEQNVVPGGGTNFRVAFNAAYNILQHSQGSSSGCEKILLFLTDGDPNPGTWDYDDIARLHREHTQNHVRVFGYALGSGANQK